MKNIAVLGSTGSIGTQTLEVVRRNPELFHISVLAANSSDELFEQQIRRCLPQMDTVDKIIVRSTVLHKGKKVTERQMAALISKALGREYSHQAVHKRIPTAAKRLAELMHYNPYE